MSAKKRKTDSDEPAETTETETSKKVESCEGCKTLAKALSDGLNDPNNSHEILRVATYSILDDTDASDDDSSEKD